MQTRNRNRRLTAIPIWFRGMPSDHFFWGKTVLRSILLVCICCVNFYIYIFFSICVCFPAARRLLENQAYRIQKWPNRSQSNKITEHTLQKYKYINIIKKKEEKDFCNESEVATKCCQDTVAVLSRVCLCEYDCHVYAK